MTTNGCIRFIGILAVMLLPSPADAELSPTVKCQAQKVQAQRAFTACRLREHDKTVRLGPAAADFAKCDARFAKRWAAAEKRWKSSCPTLGDLTASQQRITDYTNHMVSWVEPARYVDNGDGTVTDRRTGLMWEKKTNQDFMQNPSDVHDADNQHNWSATGTLPDGEAFTEVLGRLNDCSVITTAGRGSLVLGGFAGHCDWRLPNIFELIGILDENREGCEFDTGPGCIDPVFGDTSRNIHWSGTTYAGDAREAWFSFFSGSGEDGIGHSRKHLLPAHVRAVRDVD